MTGTILTKATDSTMRDDWISQVFKGELGEKQQNFTENTRGDLEGTGEVEPATSALLQ